MEKGISDHGDKYEFAARILTTSDLLVPCWKMRFDYYKLFIPVCRCILYNTISMLYTCHKTFVNIRIQHITHLFDPYHIPFPKNGPLYSTYSFVIYCYRYFFYLPHGTNFGCLIFHPWSLVHSGIYVTATIRYICDHTLCATTFLGG